MKTQKNNVATKTYIFSNESLDFAIEHAQLSKSTAFKERDKDSYMYYAGVLFVLQHLDSYAEEVKC